MQSIKQVFHFREDKEGNKRESVVVENLPQMEVADVIEQLVDEENTVVHLWILEGINGLISAAARKQVDAGANELDLDKLTAEFLASQPKSTRGLGVTKEDWEAFKADYIKVMVESLAKEPEKAEKAAALLCGKFNAVKLNKKIIVVLVELLNQWFSVSTEQEQHATIFEYLTNRAETLLSEEANLEDFL